jgi:hypothetical protein
MWPIRLAVFFFFFMIFFSSSTLYNNSVFLTRSAYLIFSILPQHHFSKLSMYSSSNFGSVLIFSTTQSYALLVSSYHFLRAHNFAHRPYLLHQPKLVKISVPKAGDCVELILLDIVNKVRISFTRVLNVYFVSTVLWIVIITHITDTVEAIWMTEYNMFRKEFREFWVFWSYRNADNSLARPGRKQATATEDFEFHISYL